MKKLNFWLLASLFVGALAFTACGDDKDNTPAPPTPPAGPTSIVGKWVGDFPAQPDNPNQLMWRYAHKLIYNFNSDNTFMITESACWYTTDSYEAEYDKPSISIDPARPAGAYLGERITHRLTGSYTLEANSKITIKVTQEAWGSDDNFKMTTLTEPYSDTYEYSISGNKLKVGDGSEIACSPHNLIAYGEMTWQGAGDVQIPVPSTPDTDPTALTKADLVGTWNVYLNGAPVTFTFTDSKLQIDGTDVENGGAYTFENERVAYRYEGEDVSFNVEMIHNKTVILAISIIPASQSYSGEEERQTSFGYREGATIPVTASDIQGKWYWQSEHGFVGARAVLILDGDKFDLIITPWGERHIGTFTYQNGYIHLTPEESFTSRYDDSDHINIENPEATPWKHPGEPGVDGDPIYFSNPGDDVIPFIPNGTKAYSELANLQVEYTKQ